MTRTEKEAEAWQSIISVLLSKRFDDFSYSNKEPTELPPSTNANS